MKKIISMILISTYALANDVDFLSPKNGDKVKNPVTVKMNVNGLKVRPAGEDPNDKNSGHHHLLIDMDSIPEGQPIPSDEKHLHYGKAQTETTVKLPAGEHKLTLQFADGAHRSYGPKMSKTIKVIVTE